MLPFGWQCQQHRICPAATPKSTPLDARFDDDRCQLLLLLPAGGSFVAQPSMLQPAMIMPTHLSKERMPSMPRSQLLYNQ